MHLSNKRAFTLAELLTAVLVISVIMVALAPVITKRMKENITVQTDNRKGLEIYTNPGSYTFDVPIGINTLFIQGSGGGGAGAGSTYVEKDISFTSTTTWTVPNGVNQITLTIIGAGGGGGGANARNEASNCNSIYKTIPAMADNGKDICTGEPTDYTACGYNELKSEFNEASVSMGTCWKKDNYWGAGKHLAVCTYNGAILACRSGSNVGITTRLFSHTEMARIVKQASYPAGSGYLGKNYMDLCRQQTNSSDYTSNMRECNVTGKCYSPDSLECNPYLMHINENWLMFVNNGKIYASNELLGQIYPGYRIPTANTAGQVRCVYERQNWFQYSGAGGASGAVMEKTINVLPKDVFEITIGSGGNGGAARTKGSQGGTTKIVHKRGGIELGTYYVKGGLGGNGASTTANGAAYTNGTASGNTTVSGTCYARNRKDTTDSFSGGNTTCNVISYSGESGTELQGGNGGRLKNEGVATQGGIIGEMGENVSSGKNATEYAFGGGGGTCARGVRSASSCSKGGKGASGRVDIVYKVALPGGGGGSASRVAGVNNDNKMYEIKYKVAEGDRIVFKVGSGGTGGVEGQDGLNGSATVIGDNDIVFLGGEGGKVATESDKSSLRGGRGGSSGCVNEEDNIQSVTSGIKIKNSTTAKYSITPSNGSFKGQAGRRGGVPSSSDIQSGYSIANTVFAYGFSGGMGGSPFNVESSKIGASITCSGGIYGTLGQMTSIKYLCTSGNIKGNDARSHDPVNNEFGGSGGGGGGVVGDSFEQGSGGNGSSGYLRIRWDMSEQE